MKTLSILLTSIVAMLVITSCGPGKSATKAQMHACDSIIVVRAQSMIDNTITPIYVLNKNSTAFKADDLVWVDVRNMFITPATVIIEEEVVMHNRLIKYRILTQ